MENKVYLEMELSENEVNHRNPPSKKKGNKTTAKALIEKPLRELELSASGTTTDKPLVKTNEYQVFTIGSTTRDSGGVTDSNIYENSQFRKKVHFEPSANDSTAHEINNEDGENDYALVTNSPSEPKPVESRHSKLYEYLHFARSGSSANQEVSSLKQVCSKKYIFWKMLLVLSLAAVVGVGAFLGVKLTTVKQGGWSVWEKWSSCSVSCGNGMENRKRTCSDPEPESGGMYCAGDSVEYRICYNTSCFGNWTAWNQWSVCTVTCGTGLRRRDRSCSAEDLHQLCIGEQFEYAICSQTDCNVVNGGWSMWEPWGQCSATCGHGMDQRRRSCSNPTPSKGGMFCFGVSSEYRLCNRANCEVINGGWSIWSSWSPCSTNCMKTRSRSCTNPAPSQYGLMCEGNSDDKETCNLLGCESYRIYVRLVNGTSSRSGRVEVSLDQTVWGTVCDDGFDLYDAQVVCRMLGYSGGTVISNSFIADGTGAIYLDNLMCYGNETSLLFCKSMGWGSHNCVHGEDVGVSCT